MNPLIEQAILADSWIRGRRYPNKNRYYIIDDNVIIQLTQGKYCIIDVDNINLLDSHTWRYSPQNGTISGNITMHTYIMRRLHPDRISNVNHISGDKLDNRESNLCFVQRSNKVRKDNTTGVFYSNDINIW